MRCRCERLRPAPTDDGRCRGPPAIARKCQRSLCRQLHDALALGLSSFDAAQDDPELVEGSNHEPPALALRQVHPGRDAHPSTGSAARGESLASHRDGRGASRARRDTGVPDARFPARWGGGDREYREYLREEQRRRRGCVARRMQPDFHRGLSGRATSRRAQDGRCQELMNARRFPRPRRPRRCRSQGPQIAASIDSCPAAPAGSRERAGSAAARRTARTPPACPRPPAPRPSSDDAGARRTPTTAHAARVTLPRT